MLFKALLSFALLLSPALPCAAQTAAQTQTEEAGRLGKQAVTR